MKIIGDQIRDNVLTNYRHDIREQIHNILQVKCWKNIEEKVWHQVWDEVHGNVWRQMSEQYNEIN